MGTAHCYGSSLLGTWDLPFMPAQPSYNHPPLLVTEAATDRTIPFKSPTGPLEEEEGRRRGGEGGWRRWEKSKGRRGGRDRVQGEKEEKLKRGMSPEEHCQLGHQLRRELGKLSTQLDLSREGESPLWPVLG